MPLAFVLGNPDAAVSDRRFLEKDLNRSFASTGNSAEEKRAQDIGNKILTQTAFLLDIHQTIEPSTQPFFIFPYDARAYAWAREMNRETTIVTHWGAGFSRDGMCTDAFTGQQGGVGLTIELGQKGFEEVQMERGLAMMLRAEATALPAYTNHNQNSVSEPSFTKKLHQTLNDDLKVFTWAHTELYPAGDVKLNEGIFNFRAMQAGETLGAVDGKTLKCAADGLMMFPKYVRDPKAQRPAELYRLLRHLSPEEKVMLCSKS